MTRPASLVLDPYDRGARLYPALLALFPVILGAAVLLQHFLGSSLVGMLTSLATTCGLLVLLAHVARDQGKACEARWFDEMGGRPSVAMLRHRDVRISGMTKARYHQFLAGHVPGISIPSADAEARNGRAADEAYGAAVDWLLQQARDRKRFTLLFQRNVEYGFRRNLTALRTAALAMDAAVVATATGVLLVGHWLGASGPTWPPTGLLVLMLIVSGLHGACAVALLRPSWVMRAAEDFARQLLAACDHLTPATTTSPGRPRKGGRQARV